MIQRVVKGIKTWSFQNNDIWYIVMLKKAEGVNETTVNILAVGDRFVLDLTNCLNWGAHEADTHSGRP